MYRKLIIDKVTFINKFLDIIHFNYETKDLITLNTAKCAFLHLSK